MVPSDSGYAWTHACANVNLKMLTLVLPFHSSVFRGLQLPSTAHPDNAVRNGFVELDEYVSVHALVAVLAFVRLDRQLVGGGNHHADAGFSILAWYSRGLHERGSEPWQSPGAVPRCIRAPSDALCGVLSTSNSRCFPNCVCAVAQCCHNTGGVHNENCE